MTFQEIPRLLRIQNLNFPFSCFGRSTLKAGFCGINFRFTACCSAARRSACVNRTVRADRPRSCMSAYRLWISRGSIFEARPLPRAGRAYRLSSAS